MFIMLHSEVVEAAIVGGPNGPQQQDGGFLALMRAKSPSWAEQQPYHRAPRKRGALLATLAVALWSGVVFVADDFLPRIESIKKSLVNPILEYIYPLDPGRDAILTVRYSRERTFEDRSITLRGIKRGPDLSGRMEFKLSPGTFTGRVVGDRMSIWYRSDDAERDLWGYLDLERRLLADATYYVGTITHRTCAVRDKSNIDACEIGGVTCPAVLSFANPIDSMMQSLDGRECEDTDLQDLPKISSVMRSSN